MPKRALLINPWIYDFKAFDFWSKPLGLLYLASILRNAGWQIDYLDLLDRYHPILVNNIDKLPKVDEYGRGKFYAEEIPKPSIYQNYPRKYKRYGIPPHLFRKILVSLPKPDWIFITSIMTYWYLGTFDVIKILKEYFPDTPIVLGGIYPTLCFEHAQNHSNADYVIRGRAEQNLTPLLAEIKPIPFEQLPNPAFDLYSKLDYAVILTSLGCCFNCTYCAVPFLTPRFTFRSLSSVMQEIEYDLSLNITNLAFYDDALLANPNFESILDQIIKNKYKINLHSPNGLHPRFITQQLSDKMYTAGFKTIYLSLETIDFNIHRKIDNKVQIEEFIQAVQYLKKSGFNRTQLHAYLLIGLPEIDIESIRQSIDFLNEQGIISHLAEYSPIPFTQGYQKLFSTDSIDPLYHNNAIFPGVSQQTRDKLMAIKAYHSRLRHTS